MKVYYIKQSTLKKHKNKYSSDDTFRFIPEGQIDFHELGIPTVYDIEKYLNEFIEDSHIAKLKHVLVITGKGSFIRPQVERLLENNHYVESFKAASYFNGQDGAFEVTLRS